MGSLTRRRASGAAGNRRGRGRCEAVGRAARSAASWRRASCPPGDGRVSPSRGGALGDGKSARLGARRIAASSRVERGHAGLTHLDEGVAQPRREVAHENAAATLRGPGQRCGVARGSSLPRVQISTARRKGRALFLAPLRLCVEFSISLRLFNPFVAPDAGEQGALPAGECGALRRLGLGAQGYQRHPP